ncbi:unnamed protein product [Closterium sp. NIES-64]|nr:unnamed protein product [Closterium sp. NIES-64]
MEEEAIERAVLAYLRRKGYKNAELAFKDDSKTQSLDALVTVGGKAAAAELDKNLANQIMLYSRSEKAPACYVDGYRKLRAWVHSSLDLYKNELLRVLYPVFVHAFLELVAQDHPDAARALMEAHGADHARLHASDLAQLAGITAAQHAQESPLARAFRENKAVIRMCQYSFDLLLQFLHAADLMAILALVNCHIHIIVHAGRPAAQEEEEDEATGMVSSAGADGGGAGGGMLAGVVTGATHEAMKRMGQREVLWGALEDGVEHRLEQEREREGEKEEGDEGEGDDGKKRAVDGKAAAGAPGKKGKKDKAGEKDALKGGAGGGAGGAAGAGGGAGGKGGKAGEGKGGGGAAAMTGTRVASHLPLPKMCALPPSALPPADLPSAALPAVIYPCLATREEAEKQVFDDLRRRVALGAQALPSVCCYTLLHAHSSMTSVSVAPDGALLAAGFNDSSVKVWDMRSIGSSPLPQDALSLDTSAAAEAPAIQNTPRGHPTTTTTTSTPTTPSTTSKRYIALRGHSGAVHATSFSPSDDRFLLSASSDASVRLWHLGLGACLVAYRAHCYPVWDVQHSPVGHYFATASYDRTARVWSMERSYPLRIMAGHLSDVHAVRWHANCNYIATCSSDKTLRLWDVQTGECCRVFAAHRSPVYALATSPDGRFLASGDEGGAVLLWDLGTGRCIAPLLGHTGCVWTLAFSGESAVLASGAADDTVRLWDVAAASKLAPNEAKTSVGRRLRLLKTFPTKSTPISALQFTRRNLLVAAGAFKHSDPTP